MQGFRGQGFRVESLRCFGLGFRVLRVSSTRVGRKVTRSRLCVNKACSL